MLKFFISRDLNLEQSVGKIYQHDFIVHITSILDYYYSSQRFASQLNSLNKNISLPVLQTRNTCNALLLCSDILLKSLPSFYHKLIDEFQTLFSEVGAKQNYSYYYYYCYISINFFVILATKSNYSY